MKKQEVKKYNIQLFYKDSCIKFIVSSNIKDVFNQYFSQLEKYFSIKRTKDLRKIKFTDGKFVQPITNDYKIICSEFIGSSLIDFTKPDTSSLLYNHKYESISPEKVYNELLMNKN